MLGVLSQGCATPGSRTGGHDVIPLKNVVDQVTAAIEQFRTTEAAKQAELKSAEFNFQTVEGKSRELGVKPLVFNFGITASREVTHTFTFTYKESGHLKINAVGPVNDITRDLVEMINKAAEAAKDTLYVAGLPLNQVDLSVQFAVKRSVSGGAEVPFELVTLGGKATASRDRIQTVKLTFERKK